MRDDTDISEDKVLIEKLVRINPDVIITSDNAK
jgi:ABC-type Fe3+-hydroxamate transport system substrate-binding protein